MKKWKLRINVYLIFTFSLLCNLTNAQKLENNFIRAFITDSLGKPIQNVNVLVIKEKQIVRFTKTDVLGGFTIITDKLEFPFLVSFKALGYTSRDVYILSADQDKSKIFTLNENFVNLEEVVVNHKREIAVIGDTIKYRLDSFRRGNEKILEDLLKNLPGFKIEENGEIKYRNKPIQKILVDGDDLTDRNYTLISKNMPSYVLEEVQVLNNFVDNPLLKGLFKSDEVALNLTFKQKSIFFGNINIGLGSNNRNDISNNIFSFISNFKLYFLTTKNNIGFESKSISNQGGNGLFIDIPRGYSLNSVKNTGIPKVDGVQTLNNNSYLSSLNSIFRLSKKFEVKANLNFDCNNSKFESLTNTQYYLLKNSINFLEKSNESILARTKNLRFTASFRPDNKKELTFITDFSLRPALKEALIKFNSVEFTESRLHEKKESIIDLKYIVRVKENSAFYLQAINKTLYIPQEYQYFTNNIFIFEKRIGLNYMKNSYENLLNYCAIGVNYLINVKNISISTKLGVDKLNERIVTSLNLKDSNNNSLSIKNYSNNILETKKTLFFDTEVRLSKKTFDFLSSARFSVLNQQYFDKNFISDLFIYKQFNKCYTGLISSFFFRPKEGHRISLNYNLEINPPELNQLITNFTLSNYINFIKGSSGEYLLQKTNTISSTYNFNKIGSNTEFFIKLTSGKMPSTYNSVYNVSERYIYSATIIGKGNQFYGLGLNLSEYIPLFSSSLKLDANFRSSTFNNYINSQETRLIKNNNYNSNFSFRSSWKGLFNLDIGTELNYNSSQARESLFEKKISLLNKNYYLYFLFKFSKKVVGNLKSDTYQFSESSKITFMNLSLDFIIKENKINFSLIGKNLFNKNSLYFQTNSDYRKSSVTYSLPPSFLMFKLEYRY